MTRAPGLLAPLLGLGLGLGLGLSPPGAGAADCGSLGRAERLAFAPAARVHWLAPRVRPPGALNPLYGTVRRFLSVVQLNPFPAGECAPPSVGLGASGSPLHGGLPYPVSWHPEGRVPGLPHPRLSSQKPPGPRGMTWRPSCVTLGKPFFLSEPQFNPFKWKNLH